MSDLLSSLLAKSAVTTSEVDSAKANLTENPVVELQGVNAPEFDAPVTADEIVADAVDFAVSETPAAAFDMEDAYTATASTMSAAISLPQHDDGLDDDEPELSSEHMSVDFGCEEPVEEIDFSTLEDTQTQETFTESPMAENTPAVDEATLPWNRKPFDARYFGFGGRTVNSLTRAGYTCFDDIKGMAHSELKELRGFGQKCLDEVLELLELENQSDWLSKRKSRKSSGDGSISEGSISEGSVSEGSVSEGSVSEAVPVESAPVEAAPVESAPVESAPVESAPVESAPVESAPVESAPVEAAPVEAAPVEAVASCPKILVIGGSVSSMGTMTLNTANFEMVYRELIATLCAQASAPSIGSIEFGKGWGALAASIRSNGWPAGVNVLHVSSSYMSRGEILMELRLMADIVIEG
jgi:hypothetical protein